MILMACGAPLWGGPIFLAIVLLTPAKQICIHCQHTIPKTDTTCTYCQRPLEVLPHELTLLTQAHARHAEELSALAKKYSKWDLLTLPILLVVVPTLTLGWWLILVKVSEWRFTFIETGIFYLLPPPIAWLLPAMFIGIISSVFPMDGLYRLLLRKNHAEYQDFQRRKWPTNPNRTASWFLGIASGLALLAIGLMLDSYILARPNEIVINPLWSLGESRYAYSDVKSIRSSMRLKTAEWDEPLYVIDFQNGGRWSTRWEDRDPKELEDLMNFISQQSGVPIERVSVLYDSDV
jgi:hypothetical protein